MNDIKTWLNQQPINRYAIQIPNGKYNFANTVNDIREILNIDPDARHKSYKKGTVLQRQGEEASHAFFVSKGLLRSYTIDQKGKEHIFMFAPEGWIIADIQSQEFNQPAELYIECLEDVELVVVKIEYLKISGASQEQLREHVNLLSRRIGMLQRRLIMMMSASAAERYQNFVETYPDLPNRVPQKMIASYLGITPEALSKIRGELARG